MFLNEKLYRENMNKSTLYLLLMKKVMVDKPDDSWQIQMAFVIIIHRVGDYIIIYNHEGFYLFISTPFPIIFLTLLSHLNKENSFLIKLASTPSKSSTFMSVSSPQGNGSIGLVASSRSSITNFGFDRSNGPIW